MSYRIPLPLLPKVSLDAWDEHQAEKEQSQAKAPVNQPGHPLARACANPRQGSKAFLLRLGMTAATRGKAAKLFSLMPSSSTSVQEAPLSEMAKRVVNRAVASQFEMQKDPASQDSSSASNNVSSLLLKGARAMADRQNTLRWALPMRQTA